MKRVIQICSLLIILICNLQSQTPENNFIGSGAPYKNISEVTISADNVNFVYELELFPGQVFKGSYYYWTTGSILNANFQIVPAVSWLSISPSNFSSTSCNDIVRVEYTFTAPQIPGIYNTVIQDMNGNWSNTNVTLSVTENPNTATVLSYNVSPGQTILQIDTLYWNGFGPFGCLNNYIPGNTKLYSFRERDSVSWFSMNPTSVTVPIFGQGVIQSTITGDTTGNDYVYLIEEAQYSNICYFFRLQLNVITDVEGENISVLPENFKLEQNFPNPFNPSTAIKYSIPNSEFVTLKVYDVLGNEVATLVDEEKPAGSYEVEFNAS